MTDLNYLALWNGMFYEGSSHFVRPIHPMPVLSQAHCDFIQLYGAMKLVFREDSFDPVTRLRRGRLYIEKNETNQWFGTRLMRDDGMVYANATTGPITPTESYERWLPESMHENDIVGHTLELGAGAFKTKWRVVGAELLSIGHVMLTLRATSLMGVIPDLAETITDASGNQVDLADVTKGLNKLVDALHRQQETSTVDVARETARVILTRWIGGDAMGKDLGKAIGKIPPGSDVLKWTASIINRLHPRGKSSEQERLGLREPSEDDAELSVHLVGMILREIGWVRQPPGQL